MRAEDFDETKENDEKQVAGAVDVAFEILVSTNVSVWPESVEGAKPVIAAVQKMMQAAAKGESTPFIEASYDVEDAMNAWGADLFGGEKP